MLLCGKIVLGLHRLLKLYITSNSLVPNHAIWHQITDMYLAINWGIADFLSIWHWETYFILIKNLKKNHFKNVFLQNVKIRPNQPGQHSSVHSTQRVNVIDIKYIDPFTANPITTVHCHITLLEAANWIYQVLPIVEYTFHQHRNMFIALRELNCYMIVTSCPLNCGIKLSIHSQTSTASTLKFGNG